MSSSTKQPESVTGVQLAQGIGHQPAQGFWTEAFGQVVRRPAAVCGLVWIAIVAFFAIFSPVLASGHPLLLWAINEDGTRGAMSSPMLDKLTLADAVLIVWGVWAPILIFLRIKKLNVGEKLRLIVAGGIQLAIAVVFVGIVSSIFNARDASDWMRDWEQWGGFPWVAAAVIALISSVPFVLISIGIYKSGWRVVYVGAVVLLMIGLGGWKWSPQKITFEYRTAETTNTADAMYTIVPFSPNQADTALYNRSPGWTPLRTLWTRLAERERELAGQRASLTEEQLGSRAISSMTWAALDTESRKIDQLLSYPIEEIIIDLKSQGDSGELTTLLDLKHAIVNVKGPINHLGTDTLGQDVLSQMLHACRLSISIGFISTGIAVVIGVTIGALMGYFGGWVDMLLYRVVEIFMAIPVLFLLIVAASVLPRNIYFMMAIIGCFTWTGAARFVRAEFMKLRETDYVQAAKAVGLPLWSILFKHMLPNGVTPVLVDSSFAIAAAILIEAILSFLGLGPSGQASWGKLLSNASGETSDFIWWLAIFPGAAIFLTTMAYNLIGEALRDAIDPKLKKARV